MKIHLDLISATDGALLGVVKVDETLYRQAQQEISCYGITLFQYLNLWFQELQTFPPKRYGPIIFPRWLPTAVCGLTPASGSAPANTTRSSHVSTIGGNPSYERLFQQPVHSGRNAI